MQRSIRTGCQQRLRNRIAHARFSKSDWKPMRAMRVVPDQLVESNEPRTAVELHTEMDWRCTDNKVLNFFIGNE